VPKGTGQDSRPTVPAEASIHRGSTCGISIDEFREVFLASNFHFCRLNGETCTEHSASNLSAVPAVAEMPPPMAREQIRVVDLDSDGTAKTVSLHVMPVL
jgi:hypothetical protein